MFGKRSKGCSELEGAEGRTSTQPGRTCVGLGLGVRVHAAREDEALQGGWRPVDFSVAAQPGVADLEGAEGGETQEAGEREIASQGGVGGDVKVVGDDGDVVRDVTGVDVDGGAGDAGEGEMGEGGEGGGEGDDETLGAVGLVSRGCGEGHGHLHRSDVFAGARAYLEGAEVGQGGERGEGVLGVDGGCEGEGEGVDAGAGAEEGAEVGSPCGTEGDGEGSDVCAVVGGDMADKGAEGVRGREDNVGKEGGEAEGAGVGGGGGEGADGRVGEEGDDGEVELGGEGVPGHVGGAAARLAGYLSIRRPSLSVDAAWRSLSSACHFDPIHKDTTFPRLSENPSYHPETFRPTRHTSAHPGDIKPLPWLS